MADVESDKFAHDAFISYTRREDADFNIAEYVFHALRRARLKAWKDTYDIKAGREFFPKIVMALERSRCVVALISKTSLESKWCDGELFMGHAYDIIVPVLLNDLPWTELPYGISTRDPIHYKDKRDAKKIVARVRELRTETSNRRGPLGLPFPVALNTTSEFLGELSRWPPEDGNRFEAHKRFRAAMATVLAVPDLQSACAHYNKPTDIGIGIKAMQHYLEDKNDKPELWHALAVLAQPFDANIAGYALGRANATDQEFRAVMGVYRADVEREFQPQPERLMQAQAVVAQGKDVLDEIGPDPSPPPAPPKPTPPPLPAAPQPRVPSPPKPVPVSATPVTPPAAAESKPAAPPGDGGGCIIILGIIVGAVTLLVFLAQFLWNLFFSAPAPVPTQDVSSVVEPASSAPTVADVGTLPDTLATPPKPPLRVLAYCDAELRCRFPAGGYSLSWVARDCYRDKGKWREIWSANAVNSAFASRDPDKVYNGEAFTLPRPCDP